MIDQVVWVTEPANDQGSGEYEGVSTSPFMAGRIEAVSVAIDQLEPGSPDWAAVQVWDGPGEAGADEENLFGLYDGWFDRIVVRPLLPVTDRFGTPLESGETTRRIIHGVLRAYWRTPMQTRLRIVVTLDR